MRGKPRQVASRGKAHSPLFWRGGSSLGDAGLAPHVATRKRRGLTKSEPAEPADRPSPPRATGAHAGEKNGSGHDKTSAALLPAASPTRAPGRNRLGIFPRNGRWQVFGLTSVSAFAVFLGFVASQPPRGTSARDEVRSRVPLRGSPGFEPGSLFSLRQLPQAPSRTHR